MLAVFSAGMLLVFSPSVAIGYARSAVPRVRFVNWTWSGLPGTYETPIRYGGLLKVATLFSMLRRITGFGRNILSDLYASNVEGTRNLLDAAARAKVRRMVYTSTVGCIGLPRDVAETSKRRFRSMPWPATTSDRNGSPSRWLSRKQQPGCPW